MLLQCSIQFIHELTTPSTSLLGLETGSLAVKIKHT